PLLRPTVSRACKVNRNGSVPLVAAIFLPFRSFRDFIGESFATTSAVHSGWLCTYTVLIGLPLARLRTAAKPAVEAKSTLPLFKYSRERLLPWLNTHLICVFGSAFSKSFCSFSTRLVGA